MEKEHRLSEEEVFATVLLSFRQARDEFIDKMNCQWGIIRPNYFVKKGASADEADDLYQEFLVTVSRNLSQFSKDSLGQFRAWTCTIADNLFNQALRRKYQQGSRETIVPKIEVGRQPCHAELDEFIEAFCRALPPLNQAQISDDKAAALFLQFLEYSEKESLCIVNNRCPAGDNTCPLEFTVWGRAKMAVTRHRARLEIMEYLKSQGWDGIPDKYAESLYQALRDRACTYLAVMWCKLSTGGQKFL